AEVARVSVADLGLERELQLEVLGAHRARRARPREGVLMTGLRAEREEAPRLFAHLIAEANLEGSLADRADRGGLVHGLLPRAAARITGPRRSGPPCSSSGSAYRSAACT